MAQFASDSFTGVSGTELSAYDSAWTQHPNSTIDARISSAERLRASGAGTGQALYTHSATPASADYSVSADIYEASDSPYGAGVIARASTSANTFYMARWETSSGTDTAQLFRFVAGVATQLGSNAADELTTGDTQNIKLECIGSAIKVYKRGSGTAAISQTDSSITAAGKSGIRLGFGGAGPGSDTGFLHLDNFSADEDGGVAVTGTVAYTNANDTSSASGTTTVTGSSATTNANDTSSASGSPIVDGVSATTNADDTSTASGSVGSAIVGTVAYTNIDDTASASGTTTVVGTAAASNENDTSSADGTTTIVGSSATTNANDICSATGTVEAVEITGTVAVTNADDVSTASGTTTVVGSSATTNTNDTVSAYGVVNNGTIVEAGLTTGSVSTIRIKKPGIPVGTPDWLKTTMEIVTGRRGNKIEVPKFQALEFTATPTKAEVEALYAYANKTRDALEQLINRLDG